MIPRGLTPGVYFNHESMTGRGSPADRLSETGRTRTQSPIPGPFGALSAEPEAPRVRGDLKEKRRGLQKKERMDKKREDNCTQGKKKERKPRRKMKKEKMREGRNEMDSEERRRKGEEKKHGGDGVGSRRRSTG